MALRVLCPCGKSQIYPDTYEGKTVPCRKCRAPLVVAGEKVLPVRLPWTRRILPLALVLIIPAVVGVVIYRSRQPRFLHASEQYKEGSKEAIDPKVDVPRIERLFAAMAAASRDGNQIAFIGCFHTRRMLAEIELKGFQEAVHIPVDESVLEDELESMLGTFCAQLKNSFSAWQSVKRCTVKFLEGRGEAEAIVALKGTHELSRFRFWLIKEKEAWGIFDYESLESGFRMAPDNARLLLQQRTFKSDVSAGSLARTSELLDKAQNYLVRDRLKEALEAVQEADGLAPGSFRTEVDRVHAMVLLRLGDGEGALAKIDRSIQGAPNVPASTEIRARILHVLKRHEEAIRGQEEYLKVVGDDAVAYLWIGMSYEALGKPDRALEAYREGIAADEDNAEVREKLKGLEASRK